MSMQGTRCIHLHSSNQRQPANSWVYAFQSARSGRITRRARVDNKDVERADTNYGFLDRRRQPRRVHSRLKYLLTHKARARAAALICSTQRPYKVHLIGRSGGASRLAIFPEN